MQPAKTNQETREAPLVAIVDDDDSVRNSTHMLVHSFGFRAAAFARAGDFLKWSQLHEAACLVLDVLMPGMNGLELQQRLKECHPGLPVVFITAEAKEHEERQALKAGAVAVLRKPVTESVLLNTLIGALYGRH